MTKKRALRIMRRLIEEFCVKERIPLDNGGVQSALRGVTRRESGVSLEIFPADIRMRFWIASKPSTDINYREEVILIRFREYTQNPDLEFNFDGLNFFNLSGAYASLLFEIARRAAELCQYTKTTSELVAGLDIREAPMSV